MRKKTTFIIIGFLLSMVFLSTDSRAANKEQQARSLSDAIISMQSLPGVIDGIKSPSIEDPQWLKDHKAAEEAAAVAAAAAAKRNTSIITANGNGKIFYYDVSTRGTLTADLAEFKTQTNQTLNDGRGWSRMGISFQEVDSGGDFSLVLSEASQVPTFYPSVCSIYWSCRVGRYVIINQDRWLYASDAWNQAGGSLRDYRHMVINHETGHWLGHDHTVCGGAGQPAPVMQQQSIDLQGCNFNPWPLDSELWSSRI